MTRPCATYPCPREGRWDRGTTRADGDRGGRVLALCAACSGDAALRGPEAVLQRRARCSGHAGSADHRGGHSVPPPGPRQPGILAPADILIVGANRSTRPRWRRSRSSKHVTAMQFSLAEPIIENEALTVAAVDPGAYRSFTPPKYANFQDAWDRVAGGELALKERLKGKLTTDANGYLRLGGATDAPSVHIGAYVQQQPLIDAVVNPTWVETLGMTADNALLVRTGSSPVGGGEEAREAVRRLRLGHLSTRPPGSGCSRAPADRGRHGHGRRRGGRLPLHRPRRRPHRPRPGVGAGHITTEVGADPGPVTCNKVVFPQLKAALQEIHEQGLDDKIHPEQFAGCYYPRFIAGTSTLSNHAFGLALDINGPRTSAAPSA